MAGTMNRKRKAFGGLKLADDGTVANRDSVDTNSMQKQQRERKRPSSQPNAQGERDVRLSRASLQRGRVYCDQAFYFRALHWFLAELGLPSLPSVERLLVAGEEETPTKPDLAANAESQLLDGHRAKRQKRAADLPPVRRQPPRQCKKPRAPLPARQPSARKSAAAKSTSPDPLLTPSNLDRLLPALGRIPGLGQAASGKYYRLAMPPDLHSQELKSKYGGPAGTEFITRLRKTVQDKASALRAIRNLPDPGHELGHDPLLHPAMPPMLTVQDQLRQLELRRKLYPPLHERPHRCLLDMAADACGRAEDNGRCLHGAAMNGLAIVDGALEKSKAPEAEMLPSPSLGNWPDFSKLPVEVVTESVVQMYGLRVTVDVCQPVTRILMV